MKHPMGVESRKRPPVQDPKMMTLQVEIEIRKLTPKVVPGFRTPL